MFADDTACLARNRSLDQLMDFANTELNKVAQWFRSNKMAANVSKTKFIIFHTRGKHVHPNIKLLYNDNDPNTNSPELIHEIERYHSNHPVHDKRAYKILGIYIDENLSFDKHTTHLCSKISRSLYCINRAKNFLNKKSLVTLYYSLVHSHLSYCTSILSCLSNPNINKLHMAQKKAIRTITLSKYTASTIPLFKELKILPFPALIKFSQLKLMHSIVYDYCPPSLRGIWTTNNLREINHELRNANQYVIPYPRIELFKKSLLYSLPTQWNILNETKYHANPTTFKRSVKDQLIDDLS
jgi:hypothetical protein